MHLMAIKATPRQACGTNRKWEEIKTQNFTSYSQTRLLITFIVLITMTQDVYYSHQNVN